MNCILDTCVISELVAQRPNPNVLDWVDAVDEQQLFLSAITIGEIVRGVERLPESSRKQRLRTWLDTDLVERFGSQILALDTGVMRRWGILVAEMERSGTNRPLMD